MIKRWEAMPPVLRRFTKFVAVGLVNMGVGYSLFAFCLVVLRLGPHLALTVSFWLGVLWNYFSTARLVFGNCGLWRLPGYALCYLVVYALNVKALHLAVEAAWPPLVAQAVLMPFAAVLTFGLVSFALTYRNSSARPPANTEAGRL